MESAHSSDKRARRNRLVRNGLACYYLPLKPLSDVLETNLKGSESYVRLDN